MSFIKCLLSVCDKDSINIEEKCSIKNDILAKLKTSNKIINNINHSKALNLADTISKQSTSKKKKVGCVITYNNKVISSGYNHVPDEFTDKSCEDNEGKTHWYVIHAEADAILKMKNYESQNIDNKNINLSDKSNYIMYITLSPCRDCAKLIYQSGIKNVIYKDLYKNADSLTFLTNLGVNIKSYNSLEDEKNLI